MPPTSPPSPRTASQVLDAEFLQVRSKLLEVAASLDRLDRAAGSAAADPRLQQIQAAIGLLQSGGHQRAEALQQAFSDPYDEGWQVRFGKGD